MSVRPEPYDPDRVPNPRHLAPADDRPTLVPQVGPDGPCVLFEAESSAEAWIESELWFEVNRFDREPESDELGVRWP